MMEREFWIICKAVQDPKSKGVIKAPIKEAKQADYKQTDI